MTPALGWLIAGIALAVAEFVVPGAYLVWFGIAALVTGVAALAIDLPIPAALGLFAFASVASLLIGRHMMLKAPIISDDPLLNERTARLVGRTVTVVTPIAHGEGRVRVGDSEWIACGPDAETGECVRIVGANGGRLIVEVDPD
jgi:membrane protein implicated in regulation of membrane protease activity